MLNVLVPPTTLGLPAKPPARWAAKLPASWPVGRADVFWVTLSPATLASCDAVLSDGERARAESFRFAADRVRSVISRGSLRQLLGRYLGLDPRAVPIAPNPHGKPLLTMPGCNLRFNSTHSGELIIHAVTASTLVGIDVERIRAKPMAESMLGQFLNPVELCRLQRMPAALAHLEAHRLWTHKEAYLKALGTGLSLDPRSVDLALVAAPGGARQARVSHCGVGGLGSCWSVWELLRCPHYVATLVRADQPVPLHEVSFSPG